LLASIQKSLKNVYKTIDYFFIEPFYAYYLTIKVGMNMKVFLAKLQKQKKTFSCKIFLIILSAVYATPIGKGLRKYYG